MGINTNYYIMNSVLYYKIKNFLFDIRYYSDNNKYY